jgi:hypothetical protein
MKVKLTLVAAVLSGCATSHTIGNMQNDCDPGFLSPSVCLVTAKIGGSSVAQYPISGSGFLGIVAPAAAMIGGAALIGPYGLAKSGTKTTNNVTTSTNSVGGQGGNGLGLGLGQGGNGSAYSGSSAAAAAAAANSGGANAGGAGASVINNGN